MLVLLARDGNRVTIDTAAVKQSSDSSKGEVKRYSSKLDEQFSGWVKGLPPYVSVPSGEIPKFIAIGGGKGGVGKSLVSANLAAKLAYSGYRVLIVDLDIGCANLHTYFGIPKPKYTLADFVLTSQKSFAEILTPTNIDQVALVAGGQEAAWGRHLAQGPEVLLSLWNALFRAREDFQIDFVLMDLGAGTHRHTMDFFATAHVGVLTVLPEPTSIENTYVFLKSHLWHLVDNVSQRINQTDAAKILRGLLVKVGQGGFASGYKEALGNMMAEYPDLIGATLGAIRGRTTGIVINQSRTQPDLEIGPSMELICRRYFGLQANFLGELNYDEAAWKSLRNRRLLVSDFPYCMFAKKLGGVTERTLHTLGL